MSYPAVLAGELMLKKGGSVNPANFSSEIFELLSIPAFDKGKPEIAEGCEIGSSKIKVKPNDILLSKIVPHIRRCWVVPEKDRYRQIASGEWIIFRDERFHPSFLKFFLTSDIFHRQFMETVAGVGGSLVRARPAAVERIEIPFPPLAEQKRIAAILDKADSLRRKRQQAIELADEFLRAVFLDMFGDPVTNPKGWEIKKLNNLCVKITDGTHHSPPVVESGVPYITAKHLKKTGLEFFKDPWYISEESHKSIYARCKPEKHDVIYIKDGATTGLAAINIYDFEFSMLSSLALLKPNTKIILPEFLCMFLNNNQSKKEIISNMAGAGITRLTLSKIKEIKLPVAPLHIQENFSKIYWKVKKNLDVIDESNSLINNGFDSLSQKAFAGEL